MGRYVLWAGAQTLYGVPEHPEEDARKISVASWFKREFARVWT